jgi:threonine aldolase
MLLFSGTQIEPEKPPMDYSPLRMDPSMPPLRVNLYSDTQTRPTPAMKAAMMDAEVGDEQFGWDPTTTLLQERMAALMGKEAALFLPSGTMCNQIAIATHCRPGDEILAHETAHILTSEGGAVGAITGAQITGLKGARGQFDADALRAAIRPRTRYAPPQTLMEIEQTANSGGGTVWKLETINQLCDIAHEHGLRTHMDGARLMNACVAAGIAPKDMVAGMDSLWLDFTKGLGTGVGAVLCGSAEFIGAAWRWKQRLGGSMRQSGMLAAGCLHALDHHIDRLADDHANAKRLARGLAQIPGLVPEEPETNLVFFSTEGAGLTAAQLADRARAHGVAVSTNGKWRVRACTHLDVTAAMIDEAVQVFGAVAKAA